MAIGGLTPYEKFLKIKSENRWTKNSNYAISRKTQEKEVMNKKLAA